MGSDPEPAPRRPLHTRWVRTTAFSLAILVAFIGFVMLATSAKPPFSQVFDNRAATWVEVTSVRPLARALDLADGRRIRYPSGTDVPVMIAANALLSLGYEQTGNRESQIKAQSTYAEIRANPDSTTHVTLYVVQDFGLREPRSWLPWRRRFARWRPHHTGEADVETAVD